MTMTDHDERVRRFREIGEAAERLLKTFGWPPAATAAAAIDRIAHIITIREAVQGSDVESPYPEPTRDHIVEALKLVAAARAEVDAAERRLFTAARGAGVTLEEIGVALGAPEQSARQRAWHRARKLGVSTSEGP